jgi:hypothetical protein
MMTTIKGTYCPRLKCLEPTLKKWVGLNETMFRYWRKDDDVPWWHNEYASLSTLSGAIWRLGGVAIEEYSDSKHRISRKTGLPMESYSGRVDSYYEIDGHEFKVEAKFCYVAASKSPGSQKEDMIWYLSEAAKDARKSDPDGQRRLAVVFATPYLPKSQGKALRERIESTVGQVEALVKTREGDACAWVFPCIEKCISEGNLLYPGTAVIINEV